MKPDEALQRINTYDECAIIAYADGSIANVVEIHTKNIDELKSVAESYRDSAFHVYQRAHSGNINLKQLNIIVHDIIESIAYGNHHNLRPGVNITNIKDNIHGNETTK
jgi:hypothetical protein